MKEELFLSTATVYIFQKPGKKRNLQFTTTAAAAANNNTVVNNHFCIDSSVNNVDSLAINISSIANNVSNTNFQSERQELAISYTMLSQFFIKTAEGSKLN